MYRRCRSRRRARGRPSGRFCGRHIGFTGLAKQRDFGLNGYSHLAISWAAAAGAGWSKARQMPMISASPRRLTVFKSVVDLGGFNLAAARLGIAQPSVGAHIKALEAQIGQPLFYRHRGSKPQLTKAGEAVYAFAVDVLRKSQETTNALAGLRKGEAEAIAIAVHRDIATQFLPERLATF